MTTRSIHFTSIRSPTAASLASDNATSPDTFIGVGEVALYVCQRIAAARLKGAARDLRGRKPRAAPTTPGGGERRRH